VLGCLLGNFCIRRTDQTFKIISWTLYAT
jgi:hypothetical protein